MLGRAIGEGATTGLVVAACLACGPGPVWAQAVERDVFVTVLDASGVPIAGLTTEHFAVREDGTDRRVVRVQPFTAPMHVALLVDTSAYVGTTMEPYRNALSAFIGMVAPGNQVAVYEFGQRASVIVPFTNDIARLREGIGQINGRPDGIPQLIDAVDLACRDMKPLSPARPVIVAVTVTGADASKKSAGSAIKLLIEQSTVLHVVAMSGPTGPASASNTSRSPGGEVARLDSLNQLRAVGEGDRERSQLLKEGTQKTAGGVHRVASMLAIATALDRVSAELGATYKLTYAKPSPGKSKDLQVGVMLQDVTVRANPAPTPVK